MHRAQHSRRTLHCWSLRLEDLFEEPREADTEIIQSTKCPEPKCRHQGLI